MTFVRYGKPGARSTALEAAEPIGRYDGSAPLRVTIPVLGSPCTGAVVHVGTTLPDDLLPSSRPVVGVIGGPTVYDPTAALLAGGGDAITAGMFSPIIAIDDNGGPKCQVTLSVR